jgi:hypothetical protein
LEVVDYQNALDLTSIKRYALSSGRLFVIVCEHEGLIAPIFYTTEWQAKDAAAELSRLGDNILIKFRVIL